MPPCALQDGVTTTDEMLTAIALSNVVTDDALDAGAVKVNCSGWALPGGFLHGVARHMLLCFVMIAYHVVMWTCG